MISPSDYNSTTQATHNSVTAQFRVELTLDQSSHCSSGLYQNLPSAGSCLALVPGTEFNLTLQGPYGYYAYKPSGYLTYSPGIRERTEKINTCRDE